MSKPTPEQQERPGQYSPPFPHYKGFIRLPYPFTVADYKTWYRALAAEVEGDSKNWNDWRAALAVIEHNLTDWANGEDIVLSDGGEDVPLELWSWVTIVVNEYIEQHVNKNNWPEPPTEETIEIGRFVSPFPNYPGFIQLAHPFMAPAYKLWQNTRKQQDDNWPVTDIVNSPGFREWRAALAIIIDWDLNNDIKGEAIERDVTGDSVPLEIFSWIKATVDDYLTARLDKKKWPKPSATTSQTAHLNTTNPGHSD